MLAIGQEGDVSDILNWCFHFRAGFFLVIRGVGTVGLVVSTFCSRPACSLHSGFVSCSSLVQLCLCSVWDLGVS
ncbi:hypothetical protein M6B38_113855 [Iris pallida]|uniref:Uncharacterized protein n=1 Tax=Iris pallida TaxID=29817 RepID=A0AAX6EVM7_IRIPA|nr:hypothetical protein M6B38_168655 [Iris pallida]KAJ6853707.1 hypothetical protein M6B38_113855 [Iris pallida]